MQIKVKICLAKFETFQNFNRSSVSIATKLKSSLVIVHDLVLRWVKERVLIEHIQHELCKSTCKHVKIVQEMSNLLKSNVSTPNLAILQMIQI